MFRLLFLLSLTLAGLPSLHAQSVDFTEKNKDLGGAPSGTTLTHHFYFTNNTGQTLQVLSTRTSCNKCSSVAAAKSVVQPGETSSIVVNVFTANFLGYKPFTIYAMFDKPYTQEVMLSLQATSRTDIMLSPDKLSFGRIKFGASPTLTTNLEYRGSLVWNLEGFENDNGYIQPSFEKVGTVNGAQVHKIIVKLREDLPVGSWHATIGVKTNDPTAKVIRLPITVDVEGLLTATPSVIDVNAITSGTMTRKVSVRGAKEFKILKIEGLTDDVKVDVPSESKVAHILTLNIQPKDGKPVPNQKLKIITDMDKQASVEVQIQGPLGGVGAK